MIGVADAVLNRWLGWENGEEPLTDDAERVCERIKEKISQDDVFVDVNEDHQIAWGQYIDSDSDQKGIYGTGMACQILTTGDSYIGDDTRKKLIKAENWLLDEWISQTDGDVDEHDYTIVFKHAWFLKGLDLIEEPVDSIDRRLINSGSELDKFAEDLWKKRHTDEQDGKGWSRYCHLAEGDREEEPKIYSSLIALFALLRFQEYYQGETHEYWTILKSISDEIIQDINDFEQKQVGSKKALLTQAGLCVLILCMYIDEMGNENVQDGVSERIETLVNKIGTLIDSPDTLTEGEYEIHLFTTPPFENDSTRYENHYVIFLPKPIVGLALIKAGQLDGEPYSIERNWEFIDAAVNTYVEEIGTQAPGAYETPETGLAAVGDHFWIVRFLDAFSDIRNEDLSTWNFFKHEFLKKTPLNVLFGSLIIVILVIVGWITLAPTSVTLFQAFIAGIALAFANAIGDLVGDYMFGSFFD